MGKCTWKVLSSLIQKITIQRGNKFPFSQLNYSSFKLVSLPWLNSWIIPGHSWVKSSDISTFSFIKNRFHFSEKFDRLQTRVSSFYIHGKIGICQLLMQIFPFLVFLAFCSVFLLSDLLLSYIINLFDVIVLWRFSRNLYPIHKDIPFKDD